jgi:hypothetical protein
VQPGEYHQPELRAGKEDGMARQLEVQCQAEPAAIIVAALLWFVDSHYPYAADECSAAAREALLDLVDRFERELLPTGKSAYSSRIRAFVCEAIKGYAALLEARDGESYALRAEVLIAICRGESAGEGYAAALAQDRSRG